MGRLPGSEVHAVAEWEAHNRRHNGIQRAEHRQDEGGFECCALVDFESLFLFGAGGEDLSEGIGLPDDCQPNEAERRRDLEEALDHPRQFLSAADHAVLCGNWLDGNEREQDAPDRDVSEDGLGGPLLVGGASVSRGV